MTDAYWRGRGCRAAPRVELVSVDGLHAEPVRQVGRWFEHVHLAALRSTPDIEVLAANEPLRDGTRTIGELDVLYRQDARVVHREVAVKYYLAARPGTLCSAWVGPGKRDRLDLKLDRLATHQVTVAQQARAADAWPQALPFPDITEVLMVGALFSPSGETRLPDGARADADHGHWYFASEFAKRFEGTAWCTLGKPWWLSPEHARSQPVVAAQELAKDLRRPRFVARAREPVERAFVVPDGWWDDLPVSS